MARKASEAATAPQHADLLLGVGVIANVDELVEGRARDLFKLGSQHDRRDANQLQLAAHHGDHRKEAVHVVHCTRPPRANRREGFRTEQGVAFCTEPTASQMQGRVSQGNYKSLSKRQVGRQQPNRRDKGSRG